MNTGQHDHFPYSFTDHLTHNRGSWNKPVPITGLISFKHLISALGLKSGCFCWITVQLDGEEEDEQAIGAPRGRTKEWRDECTKINRHLHS
uniref:Uncharacterized protein n=1 Tax=Oryzias latipes TaxID=8090 RepID=A0A3P9KVI1_ORYLA